MCSLLHVKKILILIWFKYVIKERGIYIPKRIVRKIARLTHECFEIFIIQYLILKIPKEKQ